MKKKSKINKIFANNKFVLVFSVFVAFFIWCAVVITASPQTTRIIKDVKVIIDESVSSQFELEVFGDDEFYVDVTVVGKKYQVSGNNLSKDDVVVTALTNNVKSEGTHNLQLVCEPVSARAVYTIESISQDTINVYFDKRITVNLDIEPMVELGNQVITDSTLLAGEGFSCGEINLSETSVSISGPSEEIHRIDKAIAKYAIDEPLVSNLSAEVDIVPVDKNNDSNFQYLEFTSSSVVFTVPVYKVKVLDTVVDFKNAPASLTGENAPQVTISPDKAAFDTSVEDYANITTYTLGTIDFRKLKPGKNEFKFTSDRAKEKETEFVVVIDLSEYTQETFSVEDERIEVNNPDGVNYSLSKLSNVTIIGKQNSLNTVSIDDINVEIDLTGVELIAGESVEIPAVVTVNNDECWVYGGYKVTVTGE